MASSDFGKLKPKTQRTYRYQIKRIEAAFSEFPISALSDRSVRSDFFKWRDKLGQNAPRQADIAIRVLQRIISWGYDRGDVPANPLDRVALMYRGTRRDKVWTSEQEENFMAKAPKGFQIALQLALQTGQRKGDLLELTWSAYDGKHIRLKQSKGSARVAIPVGKDLKQRLDEAKAELQRAEGKDYIHEARILVNSRGDPWSEGGFSHKFKRIRDEAGVEGVTFHDLRGTVVMRLWPSPDARFLRLRL